MEIKHKDLDNKGSFYIEDNTGTIGVMTYSKAGDSLIIIDHTEVSDTHRGTGAGKQLLMKAVDYARINNIKILPLCPFARSVFDKDTSISDVLN